MAAARPDSTIARSEGLYKRAGMRGEVTTNQLYSKRSSRFRPRTATTKLSNHKAIWFYLHCHLTLRQVDSRFLYCLEIFISGEK
jgi:hypothetical protein